MTLSAATFHAELDKDVAHYLERIRQIDRILERPVRTLIKISHEIVCPPGGGSATPQQFHFPALLSDQSDPTLSPNPLTQALCFGTLQRLWRRRRRFAWLEKNEQLRELLNGSTPKLIARFLPSEDRAIEDGHVLLDSDVFGAFNPYTAGQVFRVLVDAGEAQAHSGVGCLAFFAMAWALHRRYPEPDGCGARVEPWHPTAYVTANCVLPILGVKSIATSRADTLDAIAGNLRKLHDLAFEQDPRSHWFFNVQLDALSANLQRLSDLAIDKDRFKKCADSIAIQSAGLLSNGDSTPYSAAYATILKELALAIQDSGTQAEKTLRQAQSALEDIERTLVKANGQSTPSAGFRVLEQDWGLRFSEDLKNDALSHAAYWNDVSRAASDALAVTKRLLDALAGAAQVCKSCKLEEAETALPTTNRNPPTADELLPHFATVHDTLTALAATNRTVAKGMGEAIEAPARWCHSIVAREIAHESAGNITEFDPSELVSAIAVAVRCNLMTTRLQVTDAIEKAIKGVQNDGSWLAGQPFYSPDGALGIWPVTSDIVWTLVGAIEQQPDVTVADDKLFTFVDWLERTVIGLRERTRDRGEPSPTGWASDRLRHRRKVHLATTAYSINALLEIRDLVEYRLWQLCKKRFTTPTVPAKGLAGVDPVDLGAIHERRLHSKLAKMARCAQRAESNADYSLVLHGPPGSSKTRLAEALSAEMWKTSRPWGSKEPRLIRVTPADFTRLGEDRLDSEARVIFDLLGHIRGVTILFDEIDDLLRRRDQEGPPRFMDLVVPAMLNRLADLRENCPRQELCFLLGTNYVENIERALIRKGRIDRAVAVVYPDEKSRQSLIHEHLHKRASVEDIRQLAKTITGWPWMTIDATCKIIVSELDADEKADWNAVVEKAIKENGAQFTQPDYESRLRRDKTKSPELLDEYLRYVICSCACPEDYGREMSAIAALHRCWGLPCNKIQALLTSIFVSEKRGEVFPLPAEFLAQSQQKWRAKTTDGVTAPPAVDSLSGHFSTTEPVEGSESATSGNAS
jgi:hypothetical protein